MSMPETRASRRGEGQGGDAAGVAVVAVSRAGSALAERIASALPDAEAHVPARFLPVHEQARDESGARVRVKGYHGRTAELIAGLFQCRPALVLVMAAGAAVRLIAPHLASKRADPAVVVVDDAGRFAISLIGGHTAAANELARQIASTIDARPVVTTASEAAGAPPIEQIARERGWRLGQDSCLTRLLAALVNGERVVVFQDAGDRAWLARVPRHVRVCGSLDELASIPSDAALIVSDRNLVAPPELTGRATVYHPPVLVLGIGCSRGAGEAEIDELVDSTLRQDGLSPLAVAGVATIDVRRDEPGLRAWLARRGWPLFLRSAEELAATPGEWTRSEIVRRAVNTPGVAEPAALGAAGVERLAVRKVKAAHVTLAIARSPVEIVEAGKEAARWSAAGRS
jgi:cobalt-precorrin 5A hydrolase